MQTTYLWRKDPVEGSETILTDFGELDRNAGGTMHRSDKGAQLAGFWFGAPTSVQLKDRYDCAMTQVYRFVIHL
jgi:hypothetical protein